jgi:chloramphenicol 3-O phosphotransferase
VIAEHQASPRGAQGAVPAGSPDRAGRVVLLNGPPSCGKTSLALSLVGLPDEEPWFHRSLDDLRHGYADRFWIVDDGTLFGRTMRGYLALLRTMALGGGDIVAEAVITPDRTALYASSLRDVPVILVGVHCPLALAIERERARTDRLQGPLELPAEAVAAVHADMDYDLELDTSTEGPDVLAATLASQLRSTAARLAHPIRSSP